MATAAKKKTRKPTNTASAAASEKPAGPAMLELKAFYDGGGQFDDFAFARFYWEAGEGLRESISPKIDKKLHPVRSPSGEPVASAAKVDLILPADAPQEYMALDHLVRRYEETLPTHEINAYAQVTMRFPQAMNLHQPWEMVRSWARSFYGRVPVLLVLHAPHLWGSANPGHVHCIVLPRRLGPMGWAEMERAIASDAGQREAWETWQAHVADWGEQSARAAMTTTTWPARWTPARSSGLPVRLPFVAERRRRSCMPSRAAGVGDARRTGLRGSHP